MATIASLAVQLIADPAKFVAGMKVADRTIKKFQSSAFNPGTWAKMASGGLSNIQSAFEGIVGPIKSLASSIPIVGGAFAALPTSVGGFVGMVEDSLGKMKDLIIGAQKLGVSLDTLGGIHLMAGAKAEDMQRAMFHMARTLGEVNSGSGAAAQNMARLGFSANAFKGRTMDTALGMVMDKIKSLADPFEKAYLAQQIFGRTGVDLVPILNKGSAALGEASKKARQLGLSFSALDAAGIMKAKSSMKEINLIVEGMKRSVAIEMAPIVAVVAENFASWLKSIGGVRGAFGQIAQFVGRFAGNVIELVNKIVVLMEKLDKQLQRLDNIGSIMDKVGMFGLTPLYSAVQKLGSDKGAVNTEGYEAISSSLHNLADQLKNVDGWWSQLKVTTNSGTEMLPNAALLDTIQKVGELEQSLNAAVAAYGRNSQQVALNKLAYEGATPAILAAAQARVLELEMLDRLTAEAPTILNVYETYALKVQSLRDTLRKGQISAEGFAGAMQKIETAAQNEAGAKALEVYRSTATPIEQTLDKIAELDAMLKNGDIGWITYSRAVAGVVKPVLGTTATPVEQMQEKIAELNIMLQRGVIDWITYSRAVGNATKSVLEMNQAEHLRMSGPAGFGSQEAYKIINQHTLNNKGQKQGWDALKDAIKRQTEIQLRQQRDLDDIARRARDGFLALGKI